MRRINSSINNVNNTTDNDEIETVPTDNILEADILPIERSEKLTANLPPYASNPIVPTQTLWKNQAKTEFVRTINEIYEEVIHWRKNLFKVPSGNAGRKFISELTLWIDHYNRDTEFSEIALKVYMILPCLMLQKPSRKSKAKNHLKNLDERLRLWDEGNIE